MLSTVGMFRPLESSAPPTPNPSPARTPNVSPPQYPIDFFKVVPVNDLALPRSYTLKVQQTSCTLDELKQKLAKEKQSDHCRFDETSQTYFAYVKNQRLHQEDRSNGGLIPEMKDVFADNRPIVLKEVVRTLQARLVAKGVHQSSGSTCLIVVMCERTLLVANVGDSRGCALIFNKKTRKQRAICLNPVRHNTNLVAMDAKSLTSAQLCEKKWLTEFAKLKLEVDDSGAQSVRFKEYPCLNVSRTLGDESQKRFGLINIPDIITHTLDEDEVALVFVFSDATDELFNHNDKFFLDWFLHICNTFTPDKLNHLVLALAADPTAHGVHDNHCVAGTLYHPGETAKYIAIFDGHCGAKTSIQLCDDIDGVLREKTQQMIQEQRNLNPVIRYYCEQNQDQESAFLLSKIHWKNRALGIFNHAAQFMSDGPDHKHSPQRLMDINCILFTTHIIVSIRETYDHRMPETLDFKEAYPDQYGFNTIQKIERFLDAELRKFFRDKSAAGNHFIENTLDYLSQIVNSIPERQNANLKSHIKNALHQLFEEFPWYTVTKMIRKMSAELKLNPLLGKKLGAILETAKTAEKVIQLYTQFVTEAHQALTNDPTALCMLDGKRFDFVTWLSTLGFNETTYAKELIALWTMPRPPTTTPIVSPSTSMRRATL